MKRYALIFVLAMAVALAMVLAGCGKSGVATFNGKAISYQDYVKYMSRDPQAAELMNKALTQMFNDSLVMELAKKKGVEPTEEQITRRLNYLQKAKDLDFQIKESGMSIEDVKDQLKTNQASVNLAVQAVKSKVKDSDIDKMYDMSKSQEFELPERVRVELVLFSSKKDADKASEELDKGTKFEQVAQTAGSMGMMMGGRNPITKLVVPKGRPGTPVEFEKAAFDTPKGKISKPFKLDVGMGQEQYGILRAGDKLEPVTIDEKDAKVLIREDISMQRVGENNKFKKELESARKNAKITILEPTFKPAEKQFHNPPMMPGGM